MIGVKGCLIFLLTMMEFSFDNVSTSKPSLVSTSCGKFASFCKGFLPLYYFYLNNIKEKFTNMLDLSASTEKSHESEVIS